MYERYSISRYHWIYDQHCDLEGLEQFATTVAALSHGHATPKYALENVLETLAENLNAARFTDTYSAENILREKATAYGFDDIEFFKKCLIEKIRDAMLNLALSHLSSEYRSSGEAA